MWDDSRLHAARSYTSPDSPFSLRSSFTQSAHLFFGLPLLLPCTSIPITLFPTYSSSLLVTRPYRRIPRSWTFFEISPTFVLPLIFSFLILSILVTPHIHRNSLISASSVDNHNPCQHVFMRANTICANGVFRIFYVVARRRFISNSKVGFVQHYMET